MFNNLCYTNVSADMQATALIYSTALILKNSQINPQWLDYSRSLTGWVHGLNRGPPD